MNFKQCPKAAAIVVFMLLPASLGYSQSGWEKGAWVTGSVVALGAYDYLGYNLTRSSPTALGIYRVSFVLLQAGLTYLLYEKFGLSSAIAINLIWWTFGVDMVYYGIAEVSPIRGGAWSGPGAWDVDGKNGIAHAGWTPVGLLRGGERIPRNTIVGQSIVGAVIGIGICISF
jgi:hypothetical protein